MVGTKRTEAFEEVVNLVPEIVSGDADMDPWDGAIAQFERRLTAERTRDGVAAARAEGQAPRPTKARSGEAARRSHADPQWHVPHQGGLSRRLGQSTLYRELALIPSALPGAA